MFKTSMLKKKNKIVKNQFHHVIEYIDHLNNVEYEKKIEFIENI